MKQILLVSHDSWIGSRVITQLSTLGLAVMRANTTESALQYARNNSQYLVIVDLAYAETSALCQHFRTEGEYCPILALTNGANENEHIELLEFGADDYMDKPVSISELVAKIKAMLRRCEKYNQSASVSATYRFPELELEIDSVCRQVTVRGRVVQLTVKEFDLLLRLAKSPGQVFSRPQLLDSVWGYENEAYEHTVNSHINRLRTKIEPDPANPNIVCTVWGVGYKLGVRHGSGISMAGITTIESLATDVSRYFDSGKGNNSSSGIK